jgi:hypothetical protein
MVNLAVGLKKWKISSRRREVEDDIRTWIRDVDSARRRFEDALPERGRRHILTRFDDRAHLGHRYWSPVLARDLESWQVPVAKRFVIVSRAAKYAALVKSLGILRNEERALGRKLTKVRSTGSIGLLRRLSAPRAARQRLESKQKAGKPVPTVSLPQSAG